MVSVEARGLGLLFVLCTALCLHLAGAAQADARSDYLVRLLRGSGQFRVRAQAAISLGNTEPLPAVVDALSGALRDPHPAVRAAAANSLGRLGDARAVTALERARDDREGPVRVAVRAALVKLGRANRATHTREQARSQPSGPARYYVAVGRPAAGTPGVPAAALEAARKVLREQVAEIDGVVLAPDGENATQADSVLKQRRLKGFYLESSITSIEERPGGGTRVAVSVIVATYPGRDMRAIMRGAATALGGYDVREQAMSGALKSALRSLPQALTR